MEKYRPKTASIHKPNNTYFSNTPKAGFQRTFFIQEKETGDKYFRSTRVGSCRKIVVKNGLPFALTFKVKNPRGEPMTHFNYTLKQYPKNPSSYFIDYCTRKQECHLGMDKKPLIPYNPNHTRSQLPNDIGFRVIRNFSTFEIGKEGLINRKQWTSTYKDSFRPSSVKRISNPGILSDMAKRTHYKLNNIEYA
jgi:hypothetical protein